MERKSLYYRENCPNNIDEYRIATAHRRFHCIVILLKQKDTFCFFFSLSYRSETLLIRFSRGNDSKMRKKFKLMTSIDSSPIPLLCRRNLLFCTHDSSMLLTSYENASKCTSTIYCRDHQYTNETFTLTKSTTSWQ